MRAGGESFFLDVDGPVHVVDFGGSAEGPVLVCVHGLGSSAAGWSAFAEAMLPSHRVLAVDLPGHGRTPAAGRSVAVLDGAAVLREVVEKLGLGPVVLVGHSMGAVVSVLTAAAAPHLVDRLVLLAAPLPRAGLHVVSRDLLPHVALCLWPRLGLVALRRRVERQSLEQYVADRLRLTCASMSTGAGIAEVMAAELQAAYDEGEDPLASFIHAARSVGRLVAGKGYRELLATLETPVQLVHGALDRVLKPVGIDQLRELQPTWQTHLLPDVGHSPHLEAPERVAQVLQGPGLRTCPADPCPAEPAGALGCVESG